MDRLAKGHSVLYKDHYEAGGRVGQTGEGQVASSSKGEKSQREKEESLKRMLGKHSCGREIDTP